MTRTMEMVLTELGVATLDVLSCEGPDCTEKVLDDAVESADWFTLERIESAGLGDPYGGPHHFHSPACVTVFIEAKEKRRADG